MTEQDVMEHDSVERLLVEIHRLRLLNNDLTLEAALQRTEKERLETEVLDLRQVIDTNRPRGWCGDGK